MLDGRDRGAALGGAVLTRAAGRLLLAAALGAWGGAARAEPQILPPDAAGGPAMLAYARTEPYRALLTQALARVPASVVPRCPKLNLDDGAIILFQPLQVAPDKTVVGGAWRHSRLARGCGADTVVNLFFFATSERRVMTVVGVPGTSRADLAQQRIARTFVLLALDPVAGGCQQFETVNTGFEAFGTKAPEVKDPGPGAEYRPWWETWTMLGCGKRYSVPLDFTPNRLGTQIVQPGGIVVH